MLSRQVELAELQPKLLESAGSFGERELLGDGQAEGAARG